MILHNNDLSVAPLGNHDADLAVVVCRVADVDAGRHRLHSTTQQESQVASTYCVQPPDSRLKHGLGDTAPLPDCHVSNA